MCDSNEVKEKRGLWKVCILTYGSIIGNLLDPFKNTTTFEMIEAETGVKVPDYSKIYSNVRSVISCL